MHGFDTPNHVLIARGFLMDNINHIGYRRRMLSGIRVFTSACVWRQILADLNATVLDAPGAMDLNLDTLELNNPVSPMELKALLLSACDNSRLLNEFFGAPTFLPYIQGKIVVALYKSGGMTATELKSTLGYAADATTHTVDTAIYQLRRKFGREFITINNGVYKLGGI